MKNEATIMINIIGNETDEEILEVSKQIFSISKYMDINLKIVRVEPVKCEKELETGKAISTSSYRANDSVKDAFDSTISKLY